MAETSAAERRHQETLALVASLAQGTAKPPQDALSQIRSMLPLIMATVAIVAFMYTQRGESATMDATITQKVEFISQSVTRIEAKQGELGSTIQTELPAIKQLISQNTSDIDTNERELGRVLAQVDALEDRINATEATRFTQQDGQDLRSTVRDNSSKIESVEDEQNIRKSRIDRLEELVREMKDN